MLAQEALSHFLPQSSTQSSKGECTKRHNLYLRVFVPTGGEQWDPTGKETHTPSFNNSRRRKKAHYMLENQPAAIILVTKPAGGHCRFQTCSTGHESRDGWMRFSSAHITDSVNAPAIVAPCIVFFFFFWVSYIGNANEAIKLKEKVVSVSPVHKSVPQVWCSKESWFTQSTDPKN